MLHPREIGVAHRRPAKPPADVVAKVVAAPGREHFAEELHDAAGRAELAGFLAFCTGEFAEEVFIDAPDDVFGATLRVAEADGGDEALLIELRAGVVLGQHVLERGVVALDGDHGAVEQLVDERVLGAAVQVGPVGFQQYPENIFGEVFVAILRSGTSPRLLDVWRGVFFLERRADGFQENEAEDDVFVFGGIEVAAQFVSDGPESGLEAEGCGGRRTLGGGNSRHSAILAECKSSDKRSLAPTQRRFSAHRIPPAKLLELGVRRVSFSRVGKSHPANTVLQGSFLCAIGATRDWPMEPDSPHPNMGPS